jgi:hypothetical protein
MPSVIRADDAATCGDLSTGSTTVFANGKGITRVFVDTAVGLILGPGSQSVFVNGSKVSLPGDAIIGHGLPPHAAPVTAMCSPNVFAGTGFVGDPGAGIEPKADLQTTNFIGSPIQYQANNIPCNPPNSNPISYIGSFTFAYEIKNQGNAATESSFKIGVWEVPLGYIGQPIILPRVAAGGETGAVLVAETTVDIIPAGGSKVGTISIPSAPALLVGEQRAFSLYIDLDNDVGETSETNAFPTGYVECVPCVG